LSNIVFALRRSCAPADQDTAEISSSRGDRTISRARVQ